MSWRLARFGWQGRRLGYAERRGRDWRLGRALFCRNQTVGHRVAAPLEGDGLERVTESLGLPPEGFSQNQFNCARGAAHLPGYLPHQVFARDGLTFGLLEGLGNGLGCAVELG